jgi:hypothetical protein
MALLGLLEGTALCMAAPTAGDRAVLISNACNGSADADVIQPVKANGRRVAAVTCIATERVANVPVRVRAVCESSGSTWSCQSRGKELTLTINGRDTTVQFDGAYNTWVAFDIVRNIAVSAVPNANPAVKDGNRATCTLAGDTTDTRVSIHDLRCGGWSLKIARLCVDGNCRNVIMSRFYEPEKHRDLKPTG